MRTIRNNKKNLIFFVSGIIIFAVFLFFRSYNLPGRVGFGWDQERDAVAAANILAGKLTLLGPRVQGLAGFFLPPYFFYIIAPFYKLFALSPYATTGFIVFWAILSFTVSYFVISKIFDKKTALFFLALWAVNPLSVSIDSIAWNPVVIPLLFILLIYLIYLYFKDQKVKYLLLIGLIFGLGASFHLQFIFISPIFIPLLMDIFKDRKFKSLIYFIIGSILPFFPILVFDLRHNFLNLIGVINFIKSGSGELNRVLPVWDNVSSFMVGALPSKILGPAIYLFVTIGLFVTAVKLKDKVQSKILSGFGFVWLLSLPLFYLLIKNPSEYYFNYLLVPALIFLSVVLRNWKRFGIIALVALLIYFIFPAEPLLHDVALSLREKDQSVYLLSRITKDSSPFNISFDVPFNEDAGFRYYLNYYKVKYSGSPKDSLIEFVIPYKKRQVTFIIGRIGIYIPQAWLKANWPGESK